MAKYSFVVTPTLCRVAECIISIGLCIKLRAYVFMRWCTSYLLTYLLTYTVGSVPHRLTESDFGYYVKFHDTRRAVAAQTARSRCKVLSMQCIHYFRAYQRQMTLHGVGVIP